MTRKNGESPGDGPAFSKSWINQDTEAPIATEIELKLTARPADLPELKRALVAMSPGIVSTQERLITTYYDTQGLALHRRGLTLRVREQADRFTQTVKAEDTSGAGMLSRGEWEDALVESRPDPAAPESGPHLPEGVAGDLRPLFITDVTRTTAQIEPEAESRVEAAIDEGELRLAGNDKTEPISEIELELKSGDAAALYELASRLLEVAQVRIETRSKSERGYRLAANGKSAPPALHSTPVTLDPDMSVDAALQKIGRNCLAQLLRNEAAVFARQPEGVHQMRVAVRRIRSALSSLKKMLPPESRRWATDELAWLAGALGPARNLDVFGTELLPATHAALPDEFAWGDLATLLGGLREVAYDRVAEAILSERYTAAMLQLLRWFEACGWREQRGSEGPEAMSPPLGSVAPRVLDRRRRRVRERSRKFERLTPRERHRLRIAVKKLRYTTELFGSLFEGSDLQKFVSRLKRVQSDLGYANDVRVAHEFVVDLFAQIEPRSPAAHAWIALLEWHDQALARGERKLRRHVRRLNDASPFWRT
jgi:triphosphatase